MNILLAPDSFKGTLAASEVCDMIESALKNRISDCNITKFPAADGGEGLCYADKKTTCYASGMCGLKCQVLKKELHSVK